MSILRKAAGAFLLALPFLALVVFATVTFGVMGLLVTLGALGVVVVTIAVTTLGFHLWED